MEIVLAERAGNNRVGILDDGLFSTAEKSAAGGNRREN